MRNILICCLVALAANIVSDRCIEHSKPLQRFYGKLARKRPHWIVWVGSLLVTVVLAVVLNLIFSLFLSSQTASLLGIAIAMGLENPAFQRVYAWRESNSETKG